MVWGPLHYANNMTQFLYATNRHRIFTVNFGGPRANAPKPILTCLRNGQFLIIGNAELWPSSHYSVNLMGNFGFRDGLGIDGYIGLMNALAMPQSNGSDNDSGTLIPPLSRPGESRIIRPLRPRFKVERSLIFISSYESVPSVGQTQPWSTDVFLPLKAAPNLYLAKKHEKKCINLLGSVQSHTKFTLSFGNSTLYPKIRILVILCGDWK